MEKVIGHSGYATVVISYVQNPMNLNKYIVRAFDYTVVPPRKIEINSPYGFGEPAVELMIWLKSLPAGVLHSSFYEELGTAFSKEESK